MRNRCRWAIITGFILFLLLSACAAPLVAGRPTGLPPADLPPANLPLADLQTCKLANLRQAAHYYNHYHALVLRQAQDRLPDDLLGLKRLAGVCTALEEAGVEDPNCREAALRVMEGQGDKEARGQGEGEMLHSPFSTLHSPASVLREALEVRTDDRRIVAELLGVPVEDVELGPNLVGNGGFEVWVDGRSRWWKWSAMFNREPFNAAAFAGGADELLPVEGQRAARVDGFWIQQQEGKSPARAGFWQWDEMVRGLRPITLTMNVPYVLSFYYRTTRVPDGKATVWVSGDPDVFWAHDHGLPATGGAWRHFVAVGWNRADAEAAICPLVRSFAPGYVEFDDVEVWPIWLSEGTTVEVGEARFRVISWDN